MPYHLLGVLKFDGLTHSILSNNNFTPETIFFADVFVSGLTFLPKVKQFVFFSSSWNSLDREKSRKKISPKKSPTEPSLV
jgi:hypothetical protein